MNRPLPFFAALVGTVVAANLLVTHHAPIPVGFGYLAPAGVLVAGLAFTIRDLLDEAGGRRWVLAAILAGAVASLLMGTGRIAVAGAIAFAMSELLDYAVYRPLRARGFLRAVTLSGIVGLVADSIIFLWIAFGSQQFLPGQILGKLYALAACVALLAVTKRRVVAA